MDDRDFAEAEQRMAALRLSGHVVAARFDRRSARVVLRLITGVQIAFPARIAEGLAGASATDLAAIEISPSGLGLHWPKLDADLYVPAILQGIFGSKQWMAAHPSVPPRTNRTKPPQASPRSDKRTGDRARRAVGR